MYLHAWREKQKTNSGKKPTLNELAHKFGVANGSIVRRWMLPANHKDFNFPDPENLLTVQDGTLGDVTPQDFYSWYEATREDMTDE